jgi:hypothetical protein
MTDKDKLIKRLLDLNLELCYNDSAFNDEFIFDLLSYGFKGYENMTFEELTEELKHVDYE